MEQIQRPIGDQIQNLIKENESFNRELDRYDALYRNTLNDYLGVLEDHRKLLDHAHVLQ